MKTHVEIRSLLNRHLDALSNHPELQGVMKIFIPEANLGNEATHMHSMISQRGDVRSYWQKEDRLGIIKDARVTDNYQFFLDDMLQQDFLRFYHDIITHSRHFRTSPGGEAIVNLVQEQMQRYHYERLDTVDRNGNPRCRITGKSGGKQDDLLIALMMALYWGRAVLKDPRRIK